MKKLLMILCVCLGCMLPWSVHAQQAPASLDTINWEISMRPKPTAEEIEEYRWCIIVENDVGVYAYDRSSFGFAQDENSGYDKNLVNVLVKTIFTNKDALRKLKRDYAAKLEGKEKVSYCKMDMQYNMKDKTFVTRTIQVFTDKDREIDVKKNKKFSPIPEESFAEALYEVCQRFVFYVERVELLTKEQMAKESNVLK